MPACKLCIAFIIGISVSNVCESIFSIDQLVLAYGLLLLVSLLVHTQLCPAKKSIFWYGIFIFLGFLSDNETNLLPHNHFSNFETSSELKGTIIYHKAQKKSDQYWLKLDSIIINNEIKVATGKLLVSIYPHSTKPFIEGTQLLVPASYNEISKNPNPHTFDYKSFMARSGIHHKLTISSSDITEASGSNDHFFYYYLGILRKKISEVFDQYIKDPSVKPILLALTLGEKSTQLDGLKQDYIKTGTVHVLAISGLHVGTIAAVFLMLLKRVSRNLKFLRLIIILLAVLTVWLFACLSGLSQSVSRAALMFSLIICGQFVQYKVSTLNIVGLSALILLLIDPNNLYSISFQFSYLAVISILLFHNAIRNFFPESASLLKYMFDLFAVSCAAQILIIPLSIYYFNQFSIIGVFLSILIVPLTALILQSALLGILSIFANVFIGKYLLAFAEYLIIFQNTFVRFFANFSISYLDDLWLHWTSVVFIYLFILGIIIHRSQLRRIIIWVLVAWNGLNAFCVYSPTKNTIYFHEYMVKPYLVQDLIIEDCLISIVSDDLPESFFNYNIKGNRLRLNYREDIMILESELDGSDIVFCFPDKSLCISKSYPVQSQEVHDYVWRVDQGIIHSRGGQLISNNLLW